MLNDQTYPPLLGNTHENLFIKGENPADFYALLKGLAENYTPQSSHEQALIEDAAIARWHLLRRQRALNGTETYLHSKEPDQVRWRPCDVRDLVLAQRFYQVAERSYRRAFAMLDAVRKENIRTARWELTFDLQKQRLALAQRKYEDTALKVKAEAKPAALQAEKGITAEIRQLKEKACQGQKRPSAVQKVKVSVVKGVTHTVKTPSNQDILDELAARALHIFPPEQVVREFTFEHGIPREYTWAAEGEQDREPCQMTVLIPLNDFALVATVETDHCLGDPPAKPGQA